MKKIIVIIATIMFVSCNSESTTTTGKDSTHSTGSDGANGTSVQGDTTSYERMSNRVDSSHQH